MGRLNDTKATLLGFEMPNGGSSEAIKSDSCEKCINWVACGSYLKLNQTQISMKNLIIESQSHCP